MLGAAVADDVMGLVILTVVTRLASEGSVSARHAWSPWCWWLSASWWWPPASACGWRPGCSNTSGRCSRSPGTLVALALAFTLAMAELANTAKLAPIVGAFVAGLALSRGAVAPRIRRELTPVGHLLIPVFFLRSGSTPTSASSADARVLGIAAVLHGGGHGRQARGGARASGRNGGDRLMIGLAMIPRGEVGLIFATLGLSQGILGDDLYASLLLVVLGTTLITPSLLTWRARQQASGPADGRRAVRSPSRRLGGCCRSRRRRLVELAATPPA